MKSLLFLILLSLTLCFIEATPTPKIPTKTLSQSCASKMSFGGVPRRAFTTRGGEVLVAESGDDLERILIQANGALVVVDYWARMIAPLFLELSQEFGDVIFVKVDVDENPELAAKHSVSAMPTFVFIKDGEVVDRLMGANPTRLQEMIEEYK